MAFAIFDGLVDARTVEDLVLELRHFFAFSVG